MQLYLSVLNIVEPNSEDWTSGKMTVGAYFGWSDLRDSWIAYFNTICILHSTMCKTGKTCSQTKEKEMEVSLRAKYIPTLIQLNSNLLLIQVSDHWLWIALLLSSLTAVKKCHGGIMTLPRPALSTWEGPAYGLEVIVTQVCLTLCHPWTVAHQAPLSMEFSRQEYWSR